MNKFIGIILTILLAGSASARPIESCGGAGDGQTDNTPAWNDCLAQAQADSADRSIQFGAGIYNFDSVPNPIMADGISILGLSPWVTHLKRTFSQGNTENFISVSHRGVRIFGLEIQTARGTSGGRGLYVWADNNSGGPGGKHEFTWVRVSSELDPYTHLHTGTWRVAVMLQGDARTIDPIGLRGVHMQDMELFDATLWTAELWGCLACEWFGGGAYQGVGTTDGIAIGGANSQKNRIDADIDWPKSSVAGTMRGPGK